MENDPLEEHHAETERVLAASDRLDELVATSPDVQDVFKLVDEVRLQNTKLRRQNRRLAICALVLLALASIMAVVIVKVESNSTKIDRTRESTKLFCDQTNRNNDKAHTDFLTQFALDPATRPKFVQFADVAWPHRNCEVLDP